MYAYRYGSPLPSYAKDINTLRGIEGKRMKQVYKLLAEQNGISWEGRRFDRNNPENDNILNQAINHATAAAYASSQIAVAVTGAIPQLGFIHETSSRSFALDIADLFRAEIVLPIAFQAAKRTMLSDKVEVERETRKLAGTVFQEKQLIPKMIDIIKELMDINDSSNNS
jgi:CRISP-associated protein Cas1